MFRHVTSHRLKHAAGLVLCGWATGVLCQTPYSPPPRSVDDVLAVLEQYKPDPAAIEKARRTAAQEPPSNASPRELSIFFHKRGRAALELGNLAQEISDYRKALDYDPPNQAVEAGGVGAKVWILQDLAIAERDSGNLLNARQAREQILRLVQQTSSMTVAAHKNIATTHLALGDIPAARGALQGARAALTNAEFSGNRTLHNHRIHAALAEAYVLDAEGKPAESERHYRNALRNAELDYADYPRRAQGTDSAPRSIYLLNLTSTDRDLAANLRAQGRFAEAEFHVRRALERALGTWGPHSAQGANAILGLALVVFEQGRFTDAQALASAAVTSYERAGVIESSLRLAAARAALGSSLAAQEKWEEALSTFETRRIGLAINAEQNRQVSSAHIDWALTLVRSGRAADAAVMLQPLLEQQVRDLGETHPQTAQTQAYHAIALAAQGQRDTALRTFRRAVPVLLEQSRADSSTETGGVARQLRLTHVLEAYIGLLAALHADSAPQAGIDPVAEAFRLADAARGSGVQRALAASAARAAASDPGLAELARREQDMQRRIGVLDDVLSRLLNAPANQKLPNVIEQMKRDAAQLRVSRDELKRDIEKRFPDYANLVNPQPAAMSAARAALKPGEALISIYVGATQSFVWAIPHLGTAAFAVSDGGRRELGAAVAHLRRALDIGNVSSIAAFPRYDAAAAHALYLRLLQPVESGWKDANSLLIVPHGALGQIPFTVLTTAPSSVPAGVIPFEGYKSLPWLVRRAAVTQLPSVNTLLTLRSAPPSISQRRAFAGFGDPVFNPASTEASAVVATRGLQLRNLDVLRRDDQGRAAATNQLAQLPRLPDTADEIRDIAAVLRADPAKDVFLGKSASEKTVKTGNFADRAVLMFATHGLVPGDLNGLTQPALAMSAPDTVSGDDDGLLTLEEILGLKLDADWVVLSACNTASSDGAGGEAVSGLGRAFFYAGARALLVSNWPVETSSARQLTTGLFRLQAGQPKLGRAEALRQTMLQLIDGPGLVIDGKPAYAYAHPMFWAPFSLVGEGAERQ